MEHIFSMIFFPQCSVISCNGDRSWAMFSIVYLGALPVFSLFFILKGGCGSKMYLCRQWKCFDLNVISLRRFAILCWVGFIAKLFP